MIFFLLNVLTCLVCAAPISLKDGIPIRQVSVRPANLTSIQYDKWKLDQAKDAAKFNKANISSSNFLSKKNEISSSGLLIADTQLTYTDAFNYCANEGGTIVMPVDKNEIDEIRAMIPASGNVRAWLGIQKDFANNQWVRDDGETLTYTHWKPGGEGNQNEKNAAMIWQSGWDGHWADMNPGSREHYTICRIVTTAYVFSASSCADVGAVQLTSAFECGVAGKKLGYKDKDGVTTAAANAKRPCGCSWHKFGNVEFWTGNCKPDGGQFACNYNGYSGCICKKKDLTQVPTEASTETPTEACVNNARWYDSYDDGCEWYEENGCDAAHIFQNDEGIDAKSACCACGGGGPGCLQESNVVYWGNDLKHKKVYNSDECASWCSQDNECKYWTLRTTDNMCYLKYSDNGRKMMADRISGNKVCGECLQESNVVYWGNDLKHKKVYNIGECASWCSQDNECKYWTLKTTDNMCYLKHSDNGRKKMADRISGTKVCGGRISECQRDTMDGIQFGDRFVQFGDWRFGDIDGNHASIAHKDGKTAQIYRSDGTLHPGPRNDWTTWGRAIGTPKGVSYGDRFIQVGEWRLGAVDSNHASIAHKNGKTAQIYRSDGTLHPGPRNDWTTWGRAVGDPTGISWGTKFLQLGKFRIGDIGGHHASIAHKDGKTAQIYRSDGTLHPGPRSDWTTWDRDIKCQENDGHLRL